MIKDGEEDRLRSTLEEVRTAVEPTGWAVCPYDEVYTWQDTLALAGLWGVDTLETKARIEAKLMFHGEDQLGEELKPIVAGMAEWFREGAEVIEKYFAGVSDTEPVWTFTGDDVGRWAKRRQAQEVLVHRFDAELAGGAVGAADATMCADGVDELLAVFVPRLKEKAQLPGTVHFHCTDTDGEWMLTSQESGIEVTREHGKGDVALRAPAQVLLQVVWRRMSVDEAIASGAEVFGNRSALDAFIDLSQF
jgi:uncharacterized protein (TIGR03083 family)